MGFIKFTLIVVGIILLIMMVYHVTLYLKSGIFPPKRVVKERMIMSGGAGVACLVLGILIIIFGK